MSYMTRLRAIADSLCRLLECVNELAKDWEAGSGEQDEPISPIDLAATAPISLEAVRAVLAEKSYNGHGAKVRALLERHGAKRLSEVDPSHYKALATEAAAIQ